MEKVDLRKTDGRNIILNAAARLFDRQGYPQTSIREIAAAAGIESSSLYYHFPSKEALLYAVEEEAFRRLSSHVASSLEGIEEPWERLTAACVAHVHAILENRELITITTKELPKDRSASFQEKFLKLRQDYEDIFRKLIDELPLNPRISRKYFRLGLIGALAGSLLWYRSGKGNTPKEIALNMVAIFRQACDPAYMHLPSSPRGAPPNPSKAAAPRKARKPAKRRSGTN